MRAWAAALRPHRVRAGQVLLTAADIHARTSYLNARGTLETMLRWGVVPVVNENDSTATDELTFGDNDALAAQVALLLRARLLVLLTDAEGLFTRDPRQPGAELVRDVRDHHLLDELDLDGASASGWGSGGMRSKVVAAEMASVGGVDCVIASGARNDALVCAATGRAVGTRFHALPLAIPAFKLWVRYGRPTTGVLVVDEGARRALIETGREPAGRRRARDRGALSRGRRGPDLRLRRGAVRDRARVGGCGGAARGGGKALERLGSDRSGPSRLSCPAWRPPSDCLRSASERARPRARSRGRTGAEGRGARGHRAPHRGGLRGDLRSKRRRPRRGARGGHERCAARPAGSRSRAGCRTRRRGARRRGAAGPDRRGRRRLATAERPRRAEGARPAGRAAGGLRGAPERHRRRRRARAQVRQRLPAARLVVGARAATPCWWRPCVPASKTRACPRRAVPMQSTRDELAAFVASEGACDVVVPRGGEQLKRFLMEHARVPVLAAAGGNCHVYLHADADPQMALAIVLNAKTQRPGVCNAAETLLVHRDALALLGPIGPRCTRPASSCARTRTPPRALGAPSVRPTRRTGRPSTSTSCWPCAPSTRCRRRSTTSSATRPATPRRS